MRLAFRMCSDGQMCSDRLMERQLYFFVCFSCAENIIRRLVHKVLTAGEHEQHKKVHRHTDQSRDDSHSEREARHFQRTDLKERRRVGDLLRRSGLEREQQDVRKHCREHERQQTRETFDARERGLRGLRHTYLNS